MDARGLQLAPVRRQDFNALGARVIDADGKRPRAALFEGVRPEDVVRVAVISVDDLLDLHALSSERRRCAGQRARWSGR
jgi:hypothetical protein